LKDVTARVVFFQKKYSSDYKMPEDARVQHLPSDVEEEDDEIEMEDDDEMMLENPMMDLLVTSDGVSIADAVDKVARSIDAQNKIFIKLYSLLSKFQPSA
jgi:hypothetical protein